MHAPPPLLPPPNTGGDSVSVNTRAAGTQGFRHNNKTNVAWADGHARYPRHPPYTTTAPTQATLAPSTAFISPTTPLYDLR